MVCRPEISPNHFDKLKPEPGSTFNSDSIMSVTKKGFEERAATAFEKIVAKLFDNVDNQFFNKLNISGIFLLLLSPNASQND